MFLTLDSLCLFLCFFLDASSFPLLMSLSCRLRVWKYDRQPSIMEETETKNQKISFLSDK